MIGIVVSDKFLIAGVWSDDDNGGLTLHNVKQIDYNDWVEISRSKTKQKSTTGDNINIHCKYTSCEC